MALWHFPLFLCFFERWNMTGSVIINTQSTLASKAVDVPWLNSKASLSEEAIMNLFHWNGILEQPELL